METVETKRRILFFLSEILAAKTIYPIIKKFQERGDVEIRVVNDGFCRDFIESLALRCIVIESDFEANIEPLVRWADIIITGKTYVQQSEYMLFLHASKHKKPCLLILPDMGGDIVRAKLRGLGGTFGEGVPLPTLLVADPRTRDSLVASGLPSHKVLEFGNPYFDELYAALPIQPVTTSNLPVGYFSTPFELDYTRGILPACYRQSQLISDIKQACGDVQRAILAKRHPQLEPSLFTGIAQFDGTPLEMFRRVSVAVGSYSTTLLEAYVAGIPSISYQPWPINIRDDVFDGRIPIVKTKEELVGALRGVLSQPPVQGGEPTFITFYPKDSLSRFFDIFDSVCANHPSASLACSPDRD